MGIDDIGAQVGLSGPALYRYFDSKQTLLAEIITDHLERLSRAFEDTDAPVETLVTTSLREPNAMFVTIRYAGTLDGEQQTRVDAARARLGPQWDPLLPSLIGEVQPSDDALRARATSGVLIHLALTRSGSRVLRSGLARECVTELITFEPGGVGHAHRPTVDAPALLSPLDRREAILAVSIPLFCDRGYTAVSLNDIGEPLGISGSAVARQFGSKEDLLAAAIRRGSEQISAGVAVALRRSATAADAVRAMLESYVSLAVDFPELVVVQNIEPHALSERYRSERRKRHRIYVAELARVIGIAEPTLPEIVSKLRAGATFGALNEVIVGSVRAKESLDPADLLRLASVIALPTATR